MHTTDQLVRYLNDVFAVDIWRAAGDLIGNLSASEAVTNARGQSGVVDLIPLRHDFFTPPGISKIDDNTIRIVLPRAGSHRLDARVITDSGIPDADLTVTLNAELIANAQQPNPNVTPSASLDFDETGVVVIGILTGGIGAAAALAAEALIEGFIEGIVEDQITERLRERLSGLQTYRFDRAHDLVFPDPANPVVPAADFAGSRTRSKQGYCDLLLVADGYTAADIGEFDQFAQEVGQYFASGAETPFDRFKTAIRTWKMSLIANPPANAGDPINVLERLVVPVAIVDRKTFNFSNLARIAEVGLQIGNSFGGAGHPIVVIVSKITPADRAIAIDVGAADDLRENSQGRYVLLAMDARPGFDPASMRASALHTLIHELGHTPLGRYLGDEYDGEDKPYHGLEPRPRNVSANRNTTKWQPWITPGVQEGGYNFGSGIFRFQENCRMRASGGGDFCPVCREELALGMLAWGFQLGQTMQAAPQNPQHLGMIDLKLEYLSPWAQTIENANTDMHFMAGASKRVAAFAGGGADRPTTRVRLSVAASNVPDPWDIVWRVGGAAGPPGSFASIGDHTGNGVQLSLVLGSTVDVFVTHRYNNNPSADIFDVRQPAPSTSAQLVFNIARQPHEADLLPPRDLAQSAPVGAVLMPVVDPASGEVSLPNPLWVEAKIGGINGMSLRTGADFRLQRLGAADVFHPTIPGPRGEIRRWSFDRMLPSGSYIWSVRTSWDALHGPWVEAPRGGDGRCFAIGDVVFTAEPLPPVDPFDVMVEETATYPSLPVGLRASSWHPNDRPIKFQFAYRHQGAAAWTNLPDTPFMARNHNNMDTLAVTGGVGFGQLPPPGNSGDHYEWRVRAVDDAGRASNWVNGRPFLIYWPTGRPRRLNEEIEIFRRLDRGLFNPRGPGDVPRLFIADKWPPDTGEVDWSRLDKWRR
jgi:hypothetical protein